MVAAFENLAGGRWEGKHLLYAGFGLLAALAQFQPLSQRSRDQFRSLLNNSDGLSGLTERFSHCIQLTNQVEKVIRFKDGNQTFFKMPLSEFVDSRIIQETVILGENLNDASLYEALGEVALSKSNMGGAVKLRCELRGGGGSTTVREFKNGQKSGRAILCIADGDRKWRGAGVGDTAKAILEAWDRQTKLSEVNVLEVRDAENLIPLKIFDEAIDDPDQRNRISAIRDRVAGEKAEVLDWLDIKEGLTPPHVPQHEPWISHLPWLQNHAWNWKEECRTEPVCTRRDVCKCRLIPGLGDKILDRVLDILKIKTSAKKAELFGADYDGELACIGDLTLAWCCGAMPSRA